MKTRNLNAALRPPVTGDLNGTLEVVILRQCFNPMSPRQMKHYRVHTLYRPKPWATISGAFNDLERHNNTNNTGTPSADGPLQHVDHSRTVSLGTELARTSDIARFQLLLQRCLYLHQRCYPEWRHRRVARRGLHHKRGAPNLCPNLLTDWGPVKDFMDAPYAVRVVWRYYSPNKVLRSGLGYRISAVSGNQFFSDAQQVKRLATVRLSVAYLICCMDGHPGLVWRADYNFYGYGRRRSFGRALLQHFNATTSTVVPLQLFHVEPAQPA